MLYEELDAALSNLIKKYCEAVRTEAWCDRIAKEVITLIVEYKLAMGSFYPIYPPRLDYNNTAPKIGVPAKDKFRLICIAQQTQLVTPKEIPQP